MGKMFDYIKFGAGVYIGYTVTKTIDELLGAQIASSEKFQQIKELICKNNPNNKED